MAARLNKKILCFVDEYGTAGVATFHLGAVFVLANEGGHLDKRFSVSRPERRLRDFLREWWPATRLYGSG
ncbi:hypothetical protein L284_17210 [Novosphingobium lindaniclasticum LE124]|uniref:DUF3800 domain-containing protein n=1 Tax=Novosphingobium lindaniclasticum LE124 TaxID=1096930 RepID=T0HBJ3_9SPHN|nr:hypothetical protein L284_17210 [Novosphingobium lindaniclasticum LE124]